jgi:hypothetical protein
MLLFTLCIAGCRVGSFHADARPAAKRSQCQANLRMLYDALVKYVSLHGDLPRDKDGQVSIEPLGDLEVQKELGIDCSVLRCPADMNSAGPSYALNPALSVDDLQRDSATVVACDRIANHLGPHTQNNIRVVLIGDGSTLVMDLPLKEQEVWRRLFLTGDKLACTVSVRNGAKGSWASSDIMWYVGQEKGYMPNEYGHGQSPADARLASPRREQPPKCQK